MAPQNNPVADSSSFSGGKKKRTFARGFSTVFGKGLHDEHVMTRFRPVTIVVMLTLDGPISAETLRLLVSERLLKRIDRFRAKTVMIGNRIAFEELEEDDIDMKYHVREENSSGWTQQDFDAFLCSIYCSIKDVERPLWTFHICNKMENGKNLVVLNIDHCVGDGASFTHLLERIFDDREGNAPKTDQLKQQMKTPQKPRASVQARPLGLLNMLGAVVGGVFDGVFCPLLPQDPPSSLKIKDVQNPSKEKSFSLAREVQLKNFLDIKNKLGVTVNDVMGGVLNVALQRYFEASNAPILSSGKSVTVSFPINMRGPSESAESSFYNCISTGTLTVELNHRCTVDAIMEHNWKMQAAKMSPSPRIQMIILRLASRLLPIDILISVALKLYGRFTYMMSNVLGPRPGCVDGKKVTDVYFYLFVPIGLYCGLYSYDGKVRLSISSDSETEPHPEKITSVWVEEMDKLHSEVMAADFKLRWTPPSQTGTILLACIAAISVVALALACARLQ